MSDVKVVEKKRTGGEARHQTRKKISRDKVDMVFAMRVNEVLQKYYPGHSWRVEVDTRTGIISILNMRLSGSIGCVLHMREAVTVSDLDKLVMRYAGELLERAQLSRLGFRPDEYMLLDRDNIGNHIIEVEGES